MTWDFEWRKTLKRLLSVGVHVGSRNGPTKELMNYHLVLTEIDTAFLLHPLRKMSPQYAAAEILWYLSGENSIEKIHAYASQYENFAENGVAFGAYGHRWKYQDQKYPTQLHALIANLDKHSKSRQAVICMWNSMDLLHAIEGDKKDLPCTLNWQFLNRNGELHMTCTMRSQDAWLGMPYDIFTNTVILQLIARELNLRAGIYTHNVGSLHLYQRNWEQAKAIVMHPFDHCVTHGEFWKYPVNTLDLHESIKIAIEIETEYRTATKPFGTLPLSMKNLNCLIHDLVLLCISAWEPIDRNLVYSHLLREAHYAHCRRK